MGKITPSRYEEELSVEDHRPGTPVKLEFDFTTAERYLVLQFKNIHI
jgi:hypothetical protein